MTLTKALTKRTIELSSLPGTEITIRKISPRQVGLDASMMIVQQNSLAREAAYRADQGGKDAQSVSDTLEYPGTPPHHEYTDPNDPQLKIDMVRASELQAVRVGLVAPTYVELCEMYDADVSKPWEEMGPDFDELVNQIGEWSGFKANPATQEVMTPAESERFPEGARGATRRNGRKIQ